MLPGSAPGGMAIIYKDLIASDERTRQVIADVTAALAQGRNCLVRANWTGAGSAKEHPGHLQLEGRQPGLVAARRHHAASPDGEASGAHADRTALGRTSSSHRSASSAPST